MRNRVAPSRWRVKQRPAGWLLRQLRIDLGRGLVRRARWPANYHQKHIEDEKRYGAVVQECRLTHIRPALNCSPEEKCNGQQESLDDFQAMRPMNSLVHEVGKSNHCKRDCGKRFVGFGREQPRKGILCKKHSNAGKRGHTENHRKDPMCRTKTNIPRQFLPCLSKIGTDEGWFRGRDSPRRSGATPQDCAARGQDVLSAVFRVRRSPWQRHRLLPQSCLFAPVSGSGATRALARRPAGS